MKMKVFDAATARAATADQDRIVDDLFIEQYVDAALYEITGISPFARRQVQERSVVPFRDHQQMIFGVRGDGIRKIRGLVLKIDPRLRITERT